MIQTLRRAPGGPPLVMGILNVTPDSFSDGGSWTDPDAAVRHAFEMIDQGADVIDVGGESTRPNAAPVTAEEELSRLVPVLRALIPSVDVPVSVDTMKTAVAERCVSLGAGIVNDVNGLRDEGMMELCASTGIHAVVMHMNGAPRTMPAAMGPGFMDEIRAFLRKRAEAALDAGIQRDRLVMDPGIGFGKDPEQNMKILENSAFFSDGFPVLSGSSRKRFLAVGFPEMGRDEASAEAARVAAGSGADIVRVHDVGLTRIRAGWRRAPLRRSRLSRRPRSPRTGPPSSSRRARASPPRPCTPRCRTPRRRGPDPRSTCSGSAPGA